jgi:uncharacterized protein YeaO (DUF488 family)
MIKLKRVYEQPSSDDGFRVLVERLWPRGVTKVGARLDLWLKDVSPSADLRKWYSHDVSKWDEFQKRYRDELANHQEALTQIKEMAKKGTVTFVYAASDHEHNSALILKQFIDSSKRKGAR